jgi:hypothetical protein
MSCADRKKLLRRWCIGSTRMSVKWQCDGFLRELVGSDLLIFVQQNQDIVSEDIRTNSCHHLFRRFAEVKLR